MPFTLAWYAPEGCPTQQAVAGRVEQLLGERSTRVNQAPLDVRETVALLPDGRFRAELTTLQAGEPRSRVLEAATCSEIAEASAVVMALAIAPEEPTEAVAMPPLAATQPAAPASTPSAPLSDAGARPVPPPRGAVTTFELTAGAGAVADVGAIAPVAAGVSATLGVRHGMLSVALRGSFFPDRSSTLAGQPNEGVRIQLGALGPLVCGEPFELPVELGACVALEVGYLHARGFGPLTHFGRSAAWIAPGAGLVAGYPAHGRLRSVLRADALVPFARTEFVLTNDGVPHRLPAAAGRLGISLEIAWL
jgi:hypothetical protein